MNALLVDIGNTRIKWRIVDVATSADATIVDEGSLGSVDAHAFAHALEHAGPIDAVFVSNVANDASETAVVDAAVRRWPLAAIHRVRPRGRECGVVNGYRDPARLGPDRWLAMIGAHARHPDRSLLVCSFGTATTIDLLLAQRGTVVFVGGLILPGIDAMTSSLATNTARLAVTPGTVVDFADDTGDAIASGVMAAQVGAVHEAWRRALAKAASSGAEPPSLCVLAGGKATDVAPRLAGMDATVETVHDLVLLGLVAVARERLVDVHPH